MMKSRVAVEGQMKTWHLAPSPGERAQAKGVLAGRRFDHAAR
jgi:hypothetical protein